MVGGGVDSDGDWSRCIVYDFTIKVDSLSEQHLFPTGLTTAAGNEPGPRSVPSARVIVTL